MLFNFLFSFSFFAFQESRHSCLRIRNYSVASNKFYFDFCSVNRFVRFFSSVHDLSLKLFKWFNDFFFIILFSLRLYSMRFAARARTYLFASPSIDRNIGTFFLKYCVEVVDTCACAVVVDFWYVRVRYRCNHHRFLCLFLALARSHLTSSVSYFHRSSRGSSSTYASALVFHRNRNMTINLLLRFFSASLSCGE